MNRSRHDDAYASRTFEEFWPHYVRMHTKIETQRFHAVATLAWPALACIAIATRAPWLMIFAPLADYAIAQVSHRVFEKNKTTPTKSPLWHTRAELRMLRLVLTNQMQNEVTRYALA